MTHTTLRITAKESLELIAMEMSAADITATVRKRDISVNVIKTSTMLPVRILTSATITMDLIALVTLSMA